MKYFVLLISLIANIALAQHTIKGVFTPAKNYEILLLYKVKPAFSDYVSSATVAEDGSFTFTLDSTATKGIYKIVYAVPQEDFNFDVIYNGKENIELSFNTETGVMFQASSENKLLSSYTSSMLAVTQRITNFYKDPKGKPKQLMAIFDTQRKTQSDFENLAKGTIALNFIKANKPYVPTTYQDADTYVKNLETHYFDYINFTNTKLQSSSFLEERMLNYVFGVSNSNLSEEANFKANIDVFNTAMSRAQNTVKRVLLITLWQQFADLKLETVANYISDRYLIPLAKTLNDNKLVKGLTLYKNTSFGQKAPDFSFEITKNDKTVKTNLSELKSAKYYIVLFWSSTCSHCLDEVPKVEKYIEQQARNKVKVIAIGLEDEPYSWKSLTYDLPSFIHVYGEGKWDNPIAKNYGVTGTPTYFVLDSDKRIVAKPESLEALQDFFETAD